MTDDQKPISFKPAKNKAASDDMEAPIESKAESKEDIDILSLPLPKLHPFLKIYPASNDHEGAPQWTIYHPIAHKYYKIGWAEFECLSRFHHFEISGDLLRTVQSETGLIVTEDDWQELVQFLRREGLTAHSSQDALQYGDEALAQQNEKEKSMSHKLMHGYLYFTVRVFRPQRFLSTTFPLVKPFLSRPFKYLMMILGLIALIMTIPRLDEFFGTFTQIMSLQGALTIGLIYFGIKIFHELGHAYAATKYNVPVPHMGLAFIILYPVFYTEATGSWRLTSKLARTEIGLAGIKAEYFLAVIALFAWHVTEPGLGQMITFSVVMISLIGSLFVNLNPLMRFDGYYVASDMVGIENLHSVAINYAKQSWRRLLLGLDEDPLHSYPRKTERYLTLFGYTILIYRFFLFLGIAILVYSYFLKPLGLIAMIFELLWFIGLPVWKEITYWVEKRADFMGTRRFKISACIAMIGFLYISVPLPHTATYPAVIYMPHQEFYSRAPSTLEVLNLRNGQHVKKGQILAILSSHDWENEIELAQQRLRTLSTLRQRDLVNPELFRSRRSTINEEIEAAKLQVGALSNRKEKLTIIAPFDGIITDIAHDLHEGRLVSQDRFLFRVLEKTRQNIDIFIPQQSLNHFEKSQNTEFQAHYAFWDRKKIKLSPSIDPQPVKSLEFEALSSLHGGAIPSQYSRVERDNSSTLEPLAATYQIRQDLKEKTIDLDGEKQITHGQVYVSKGASKSMILGWAKDFYLLTRKELGLN